MDKSQRKSNGEGQGFKVGPSTAKSLTGQA